MKDKEAIKKILQERAIEFVEHEERITLHGNTDGVIAREFCDRGVCFCFDGDSLKSVNLIG